MSVPRPLHHQLLDQARHLCTKEPRRPQQASLRRAVSSAYYAFFHLLVSEALRRLLRGRDLAPWRPLLARAFEHGDMRDASRSFAGGELPEFVKRSLGSVRIPEGIRRVARSFRRVQHERQNADYAPERRFARHHVQAVIRDTAEAFQEWRRVRHEAAASLYLVCLLGWGSLRRR